MKEKFIIFHSASDQQSVDLGQKLGECLGEGDIIALSGELGSGKTWFTKGIAIGLGVPRDIIVTSPSFALVNEYEGRLLLFHMDAYRLENVSDFIAAGLEEYFYQQGVVVMEWADRWPEILPPQRLKVEFSIIDDASREITMTGYHSRTMEILSKMENCGMEIGEVGIRDPIDACDSTA